MKIVLIAFNDLSKDPRVLKQISALGKNHEIFTIGCAPSKVKGVKDFPIIPIENKLSKSRKFEFVFSVLRRNFDKFYWTKEMQAAFEKASSMDFDLIITNDLDTVPFSTRLKEITGAKLINDLHEFYLDQSGNYQKLQKIYNRYICDNNFSKVDSFITVNSQIVELYYKHLGIKINLVIKNSCDYINIEPSEIKGDIRIVHHGAASPKRKLEKMIDLLKKLNNRFSLHFHLVGNQKYVEKLKLYSKGMKVFFHEPIPREKLIHKLSEYDIGLYILKDDVLNHKFALPNKLFEFLMARLCVAVSPNPPMADMVKKYNLGVVSTNYKPNGLVEKLNALTNKDIQNFKFNSGEAAKIENAEIEKEKLLLFVNSMAD